ncbi:ribosomal protein S18-alanine N-acetyltransferase [Oceanimonas sp. NS1]|nr:ribosomal protein S18-alanine N-acetyltransferase [Oceanimonas sp. NS1]
MSAPVVRPALRSDLDVLLALEHRCFDQDRISRRSFLRFTEHPQDVLLVAEQNDALLGYVLVLFRRNTQLARIYSIAVSPDARGLGLGRTLLEQAEASARQQGAVFMRLEVRTDNIAAQNLYQQLGYRQFGIYHDYYEDHESALRYQKRIHHYHPWPAAEPCPTTARPRSLPAAPPR